MFKIIKTSTYNKLLAYAQELSMRTGKTVLLDAILDTKIQRIKELETLVHNLTAKRVIIKSKKPQAKKVSKKTNEK